MGISDNRNRLYTCIANGHWCEFSMNGFLLSDHELSQMENLWHMHTCTHTLIETTSHARPADRPAISKTDILRLKSNTKWFQIVFVLRFNCSTDTLVTRNICHSKRFRYIFSLSYIAAKKSSLLCALSKCVCAFFARLHGWISRNLSWRIKSRTNCTRKFRFSAFDFLAIGTIFEFLRGERPF